MAAGQRVLLDAVHAGREGKEDWVLSQSGGVTSNSFGSASAPLASELMERIPDGYFAYRRGSSWFTGKDLHQIAVAVASDSMPDALAKLALHLIKEGILKP